MTPKWSPYIKSKLWTPEGQFNPKQLAFYLSNDIREVLYGGAAGGGKSEALLGGATQYSDVPGYAALLLRRTFRDLDKPGGLMYRAREWWSKTDAYWDGRNFRWVFPSGASISFGYMQHSGDELKYQSSEYQYIGFDELTQFPEIQYTYLFSRLRSKRGVEVPLRMRAATNPGGPGHEWVRKRWNLPYGPVDDPDRKFIFSTLDDNPYLNQEEYSQNLSLLGEVVGAQLRYGDWSAQASGGKFDPQDFLIRSWREVPAPHEFRSIVRFWDLAATQETESDPNPDWTVGLKIGVTHRGEMNRRKEDVMRENPAFDYRLPDYWVLDVVRDRRDPGGVESLVAETARKDGIGVPIWIEQERGGSGKLLVASYRRNVVPGYTVRPLLATGQKETRASLPAGLSSSGRINLVEGEWVEDFLTEVGLFGIDGVHDDQVDALSGGVIALDREEVMATDRNVQSRGGARPRPAKRRTRGRRANSPRIVQR